MNKKTIIILVAIILVLVGAVVYLLINPKLAAAPQNSSQQAAQTITLAAKDYTENDAALNYKADIKYPEFSGIQNADVQAKINADIKQDAMKQLADFKKEINCKPLPGDPLSDNPCEFAASGENFVVVRGTVLSLAMQYYSYTQGAHGSTSIVYLNYDLQKGSRLDWKNVFKTSSPYLQAIADYAKNELNNKKVDGSPVVSDPQWLADGTKPSIDNYNTNVGFNEVGVVVVYQQYQVAPYSAGPQIVVVPYTELKGYIDSKGPLGELAK